MYVFIHGNVLKHLAVNPLKNICKKMTVLYAVKGQSSPGPDLSMGAGKVKEQI